MEYEVESEIDLIIEENSILYPVEIKQNPAVTADEAGAFTVLDRVEEKRRGMGAIVCTCPQPNLLRENLLQLPVWYIYAGDSTKNYYAILYFYAADANGSDTITYYT